MKNHIVSYLSPIGNIQIRANDKGISSLYFIDETFENSSEIPLHLQNCITQLDEYFNGLRKDFDIVTDVQGTEFQKSVWNELKKIPYGTTATYNEIAQRIGNPKSYRAVGNSNGRNPVSIIIPCHRVVAKIGLGGYGGGLWRKEWLLKLEAKKGN